METKISRPSFDHTVGVLVKAYLNDTLDHGNCYACAVGNLVADGLGCQVVAVYNNFRNVSWDNGYPYPGLDDKDIKGWGAAFATEFREDEDEDRDRPIQEIHRSALSHPMVVEQIKGTGYTWEELAMIEFAFESARKRTDRDEDIFNGLMSVVSTLAFIHEIDLETADQAKKLFLKTV